MISFLSPQAKGIFTVLLFSLNLTAPSRFIAARRWTNQLKTAINSTIKLWICALLFPSHTDWHSKGAKSATVLQRDWKVSIVLIKKKLCFFVARSEWDLMDLHLVAGHKMKDAIRLLFNWIFPTLCRCVYVNLFFFQFKKYSIYVSARKTYSLVWRLFGKRSETLASSLGLLCTRPRSLSLVTDEDPGAESSLDLTSFNSLQNSSVALMPWQKFKLQSGNITACTLRMCQLHHLEPLSCRLL